MEEDDSKELLNKEQEKAAKGVDSVTDYYEDREGLDSSKIDLSSFTSTKEQTSIVSIIIKDEDVNILVDELEISKGEAESLLRRSEGILEKALNKFIHENLY